MQHCNHTERMKLVSILALAPALSSAFRFYQNDQEIPLEADSFVNVMDRAMDMDGGVCSGSDRETAFDAFQGYFLDFRGANRVALSGGTITAETEQGKAFWWHANKYTQLDVTAYGSGIRLSNDLHPGNQRKSYIYGVRRTENNNEYDGGIFYMHKTKDRSILKWFYGQGQKSKGFVPHKAYVFTYLYMSANGECPEDLGDNFQVVLMVDLKQRSRVVINYGPMKNTDDHNNVVAGFAHKVGPVWHSPNWFVDTDASNTDRIYDNIQAVEGLSMRYKNWNVLIEISPIHPDPTLPRTCTNTKHCNCPNILGDDVGNVRFTDPTTGSLINRNNFASEADYMNAVQVHFRVYGSCSMTAETLNYGDYHERGQICFVKPNSADCSPHDETAVFVHQVMEGALTDMQTVTATQFACVVGLENTSPPPYWQRLKSKYERKLIREIRILASSRRVAIRKFYGRGRKVGAAGTDANPMDRGIAAPIRDEEIFCGFTCEHPTVWSAETNRIAGYENADFNRGGEWNCEDMDGNPIADGDDVPYNGVCELSCGGVNEATHTLTCSRWYRPRGHLQYWNLHDLYKELAGVEPEGPEWTC